MVHPPPWRIFLHKNFGGIRGYPPSPYGKLGLQNGGSPKLNSAKQTHLLIMRRRASWEQWAIVVLGNKRSRPWRLFPRSTRCISTFVEKAHCCDNVEFKRTSKCCPAKKCRPARYVQIQSVALLEGLKRSLIFLLLSLKHTLISLQKAKTLP